MKETVMDCPKQLQKRDGSRCRFYLPKGSFLTWRSRNVLLTGCNYVLRKTTHTQRHCRKPRESVTSVIWIRSRVVGIMVSMLFCFKLKSYSSWKSLENPTFTPCKHSLKRNPSQNSFYLLWKLFFRGKNVNFSLDSSFEFFANILKFSLRRKLTISECQNSRFASKGRLPAHMALDPARESKLENDAERWKFLEGITWTGRSEESSESESLKSDIGNQILKSTDEWNIWICGVSISSCWAMDHA